MKYVMFEGAESGSPDSAEWHAWRREGIGGSDAVQIAAGAGLIDPPAWANPDAILSQKLGLYEVKENDAMRRGKENEEAVRRAVCAKLDKEFSPLFGEMDDLPIIRSSFDGISFLDDEILEIKCPSEKVHALAKSGEVVDYYRPQLAHQIMTLHGDPSRWTGNEVAWFASAVPETGDLAIVKVHGAELRDLAGSLLKQEIDFWSRLDVIKESGIAQDVLALLSDYRRGDLFRRHASAKKRLEAAKKYIREWVVAGNKMPRLTVKVSTRSSKSPDYSALGIDTEALDERFYKETWCVGYSCQIEEIEHISQAEEMYVSAKAVLDEIGKDGEAEVKAYKDDLGAAVSKLGAPIRVRNVSVWKRRMPDLKAYCEANGIEVPYRNTEYEVVTIK